MLTIIGRSHLAGESHSAHDKYAKDAKTPPPTQVYKIEERPAKQVRKKLKDIIFTEAHARWVHHPHVDAVVIIAQISNSNVHRLMVDDGRTVDILYLDAYKRMGLNENTLSPATSPLYGFTRDHVITKGTAKLAVIVGEHSQTSTVIVDFLVVDCMSAINEIIERPLLKALKVVTSIYLLTIMFSTAEGTGEVRGCQYDSRECYNKSLKMAEKDSKLPRMRVGMIVAESLKDSR